MQVRGRIKEYTEKFVIKLAFTNENDVDKIYDVVTPYETQLEGALSIERYREFAESLVRYPNSDANMWTEVVRLNVLRNGTRYADTRPNQGTEAGQSLRLNPEPKELENPPCGATGRSEGRSGRSWVCRCTPGP